VTESGGRDRTAERLGSYELEAALGHGTFGRRYRARHVGLDSPRVVEVRETAGADERSHFLEEARTAAALQHPNIVPVLDFGSQGDLQYLVTDLMESTTLAERLSRVPVSWRLRDPAVRRWIREVAAGLDHARELGATGGDLRLASVLVEAGADRALLTVFGDVRAFAALLLEVATGGRDADWTTLLPGLDAVLANRYRTAAELASAVLDAVPIGPPVAAPPPSPPGPAQALVPRPIAALRTRVPLPRPGAPAVAAAAVAVLVGAGVLAGVVRVAQPPAPHPAAHVSPALGVALPAAAYTVTVLSVDGGGAPPRAVRLAGGDRFVTVVVLCRAGGGGRVPVSPYDWTVTDATGQLYDAVVDGLDGSLPERTLGPGQSARGRVGFVVPRSAVGLQLHFNAEQGSGSAQVPLP